MEEISHAVSGKCYLIVSKRDKLYSFLRIYRINCMHDSMHSRRNITDEDLADQQKEEEEKMLVEMVSMTSVRCLAEDNPVC